MLFYINKQNFNVNCKQIITFSCSQSRSHQIQVLPKQRWRKLDLAKLEPINPNQFSKSQLIYVVLSLQKLFDITKKQLSFFSFNFDSRIIINAEPSQLANNIISVVGADLSLFPTFNHSLLCKKHQLWTKLVFATRWIKTTQGAFGFTLVCSHKMQLKSHHLTIKRSFSHWLQKLWALGTARTHKLFECWFFLWTFHFGIRKCSF